MVQTTRLLALVVLVAVLAWAVPFVLARQATVTTKSGKTLTGELVSQDANTVTLQIAGITTPIPRSDITFFQTLKTPEEEYAERRAALADNDFEGRYQLAYDLFDKKELALSLRELESLKHDFPDQGKKLSGLMDVVRARIKLQEQAQDAARANPPHPPSAAPAASPAPNPLYLTEDQINLIRLWELPADLAAAKPRVVVPREVVDELFDKYGDDARVPKGVAEQRAFRAQPGWQQLQLLFQLKARDLYPKIVVRDEPKPLQDFRRTVNLAYVCRYFHDNFGTGQIEGFKLFATDPGDTAEVYTNFYILSTAEHEGHRFIDRHTPEDSLLLQWGLPREVAKFPAPASDTWRPFFHRTDDSVYQNYLTWIKSLFPDPGSSGKSDYDIVYPPPPPPPAPAAATPPATPTPSAATPPPAPPPKPNP